MKPSQPDLAHRVIHQIHSRRIKIKSKYRILAEKLGFDSLFLFSILLAVFTFNIVFYYLRQAGVFSYLFMGQYGLLAFFESFPYLSFGLATLFLILSAFLLKKYDISYQRSYKHLIGYLFIGVLLSSILFSFSKLNQSLSETKTLKPLYQNRFGRGHNHKLNPRRHGLAGIVQDINLKTNILKLENLPEINIILPPNIKSLPKPGEHVYIAGYFKDANLFQAIAISHQPFFHRKSFMK